MSDFGRRFDASELGDDVVDNAAAAELLAVARDLETYARSDSVTLSGDFEDRVMAAIADEPPPRPMGSRGLLGIVAVVRDSWRLVWSADRPMAVRAQALAFVLAGGRGAGIAGVTCGRGGWRAAVAEWTSADRATGSGADAESVGPPEPEPRARARPSARRRAPRHRRHRPRRQSRPRPPSRPRRPEGTDDSSGPGSGSGSGSDSSGPGSGDETARPTNDSSGPGSGGDSSGSGSGSDSSGSGSGG